MPNARTRPARPPAAPFAAALFAPVLFGGVLLAPAPARAQDDAPRAEGAPAGNPPAAADDEGPKTGPPLPRGFVPPPEKPASFTTVTPLMTEDQLTEAARALDRARYRTILENGPRDGTEQQILDDWAAWRVAGLTSPALMENRPQLQQAADELLREANRTVGGRGGGRSAQDVKKQAFAALSRELGKLKDNHLVLRVVAAKLLGELQLDDGRGGGGGVRRYGPAVVPLLAIYEGTGDDSSALVDPEYAAKLAAARALAKVARTGEGVPGDVEQKAAEAFTARLEGHPEDPWWFQSRLADAVRGIGLRLPVLGRRLLTVVQDADRPCEARAAAAMALVRLPSPPAEVREALPDALVALAADIAENYNAAPSGDFLDCVRRLEFSFKPMSRSEVERIPGGAVLTGAEVPGFLRAAYNKAHPVVTHVSAQNPAKPAGEWAPIPDPVLAELRN